MSATCRSCSATYAPTAHELRKHDYMCPPCRLEWGRARRERLKAEGRPVSGTRMPPEYHKAYHAAYAKRPEVRARRATLARLRTLDPAQQPKIACRRKTRQAIENGTLTRQPCEVCSAAKVEAHHDDYSKPLEVRWLCRAHHREHHAKAQGQ